MEMVVVGKLMLEPSVLYVVLNSCEYCYQCLLWQYGNHGGCTVVCTIGKSDVANAVVDAENLTSNLHHHGAVSLKKSSLGLTWTMSYSPNFAKICTAPSLSKRRLM